MLGKERKKLETSTTCITITIAPRPTSAFASAITD